VLRVSLLRVVDVFACGVVSYVDDGLADGDDAVHDGHEAAGDGRDQGVEARCDGAHCCGVVRFVWGWCYWLLIGTEAGLWDVACSGVMLVVNGGREEKSRGHRKGVSNAFLRGYIKECSRVVTR
jgi:hypothetical protein